MTKKYEAAISEKNKEYENLYLKKATFVKTYNDKITILKTKGIEI